MLLHLILILPNLYPLYPFSFDLLPMEYVHPNMTVVSSFLNVPLLSFFLIWSIETAGDALTEGSSGARDDLPCKVEWEMKREIDHFALGE